MIVTASESSSPLDEPQMAARRKRIARLALMVFELMGERHLGGTIHEFDGVEGADLIAALRVCSSHVNHISCLPFDNSFAIEIEGIDGHSYIIEFSLLRPGFSVHAARVRVTRLSIPAGPEGQEDTSSRTFDILEGYSERLKVDGVTADRAFLVGMSMVIGFIDPEGEDQDERLQPLVQMVAPRREELRRIRAKLPPTSINYDEEGDQPF